MNWYYVKEGQQAGPVSEAELDELIRSGALAADTLVWREGMAEWVPYTTAKPGAVGTAGKAPLSMSAAAHSDGNANCAECGNSFAISDMVRHGRSYVCAACKPVFMQRLAEGAKINTGPMEYASFLTRFAAVFLDGLILGVLNVGLNVAVGLGVSGAGQTPGQISPLQGLMFLVQMVIGLTYEGVMIGKYGATLGKMACKIRVVRSDGSPLSYGRSFGRYFMKLVSYMTCLIGLIIAAFDDQRRSLHDRICDTRVVLK